ncbi:MAG: AI-2E family transporter [Methylibium sp.]|uniref:AI-2E family transporter n=1 Tax=Methylibium sp. TaxID=2067992 RepID=UPI001853B80D|nr:AI-2E family transporter [Methylibium sp.]MBA3598303.1 AI-2E family transporter [Methylibium sp.]
MTRALPTAVESTSWSFPRKVALVAFSLLLALIAWQLMDLFMLAFGAIIVAAALRVLAGSLEKYLRVPAGWSVMSCLVLLTGLLVLGIWLVGDPLVEQFERLREGLPAAVDAVMGWLNNHRVGTAVLQYVDEVRADTSPLATRLAGYAGLTFGALGSAGLMLIMGIYLAVSPRVYRNGLIRLVPPALRNQAADALDASGAALSRWLLGQSVSMLFVGSATALGLWLLDVPLAFSVGVVSGLLAFIPFFGAIAGGLLAVLLGFMQGPQTALYVVILALTIQQMEGQVLMPFVQRWAVDLPPVLGLAAAVMFGVLFGLMGVLLATPAMVVLMVLVQKLYIDGVLEKRDDMALVSVAGRSSRG